MEAISKLLKTVKEPSLRSATGSVFGCYHTGSNLKLPFTDLCECLLCVFFERLLKLPQIVKDFPENEKRCSSIVCICFSASPGKEVHSLFITCTLYNIAHKRQLIKQVEFFYRGTARLSGRRAVPSAAAFLQKRE